MRTDIKWKNLYVDVSNKINNYLLNGAMNIAVKNGNLDVVKELMSQGANSSISINYAIDRDDLNMFIYLYENFD